MLKDKLLLIPSLPGSYQMYDKNGVIIYIGKAKDLHKRVLSYFNRPQQGKTAKLVSEITDIKYLITNSEVEALVLELNLIKKHMPKYNMMLTDDKSYPYIEYIKKPYPRLKISRYLTIKKNEHKLLFGPYPNAYAARQIVNVINRLYPLKKCSGNPREVCLFYHINECLGYCQKKIDQAKIQIMENDILAFLKGNDEKVINELNNKMITQSNNLNYEAASELKKDLEYLKVLHIQQKVELKDFVNRDIIGYYYQNGLLSIHILFLRHGKIIGNLNKIFNVIDNHLDELELYITKFYTKNEVPNELLIDQSLNKELLATITKIRVITPIKGTKYKLLELAKKNAQHHLENNLETRQKDEARSWQANEELRLLLNLNTLKKIEIFDNSNLFGDYAVSAMVVYYNGQPMRKDYRKYKISLAKNDDYNTMKEVIYRRYYRLLIEKKELPDLILVDGGQNQINAALDIITQLNLTIPVYGLKKDDHHQTSQLVDCYNQSFDIAKKSDLFFYLSSIQDEVHRYTISFHRQIKSKGSIASVLENIPGIGFKRRQILLKKFGSVKKIKESSDEELKKYLPEKIINNLRKYLANNK